MLLFHERGVEDKIVTDLLPESEGSDPCEMRELAPEGESLVLCLKLDV